jgi:hypothetical protein
MTLAPGVQRVIVMAHRYFMAPGISVPFERYSRIRILAFWFVPRRYAAGVGGFLPGSGGDLDAVDGRVGLLAEVLDPGLLDARVVLGRLDQVQEVDDVGVEAGL